MKLFKSKDCPSCPAAKKNVKEVLSELEIGESLEEIDISTEDGMIDALNNMVLSSPALVFKEQIITKEVLLEKERLTKEIEGIWK